ncbi:MAG TPA: hypothetical protein VL461_09700 [Dictyobacter sp.]|jgi:hypothetical protein|nr:hypothetical protein [Dictyobacter sp.]
MYFKRLKFMFIVPFLLALLISFGGAGFFSGTVHADATTPTIALSSKNAHPGQKLTLTGQGLTPQTPYQIMLGLGTNHIMLASYIESDDNGDLSTSITFPQNNITQGDYPVYLYSEDDTSTPIAQTTIQIIPTLFQITGNAGLPVTMTGAGFNGYETVSIYFDKTDGTAEGTAKSDASGNISFSFTMPSNLPAGTYPVEVERTAQKPLTVTGKIRLYTLSIKAPGGVKANQGISVTGKGFEPDEYVTLSWNANGGQQLYSDVADATGAFYFSVNLPSAPLGNYTITAQGNSSGLTTSTPINVGPGINLYTTSSTADQGNPGGQITVYGGGFNPNEQVNVYFQTAKNGITTTTTDSTGNFTATITAPMQFSPQTTYYVYAKNVAGTVHTRTKFTYGAPTVSFLNRPSGADYSEGVIIAGGFGANETIQVVDRYQQSDQVTVTTLTADATGFAEAGLIWPSSAYANQITFAAIGQTTNLVATNTHIIDPTLLTDNESDLYENGNAGDTLQFQGKNFAANEEVNITFNGTIVSTATSDAEGYFSGSFVAPPLANVSNGAGNIKVAATGVTSGLVSSPFFSWNTFYYQPTLTISPTSGPSGTTITVTGEHFPANALVPIGWDGPFNSNPQLIGYPDGTYAVATADQNGNITLTIQANDLVSGQTYHVTASSMSGFPGPVTDTFVAQ